MMIETMFAAISTGLRMMPARGDRRGRRLALARHEAEDHAGDGEENRDDGQDRQKTMLTMPKTSDRTARVFLFEAVGAGYEGGGMVSFPLVKESVIVMRDADTVSTVATGVGRARATSRMRPSPESVVPRLRQPEEHPPDPRIMSEWMLRATRRSVPSEHGREMTTPEMVRLPLGGRKQVRTQISGSRSTKMAAWPPDGRGDEGETVASA